MRPLKLALGAMPESMMTTPTPVEPVGVEAFATPATRAFPATVLVRVGDRLRAFVRLVVVVVVLVVSCCGRRSGFAPSA